MKQNFMTMTTSTARPCATAGKGTESLDRVANQRNNIHAELQALKLSLLRPALQKATDPELCHRLRLAANEALATAWARPFPFLLLPCLLEDKIREVQQWFQRQQRILAITRSLFEECDLLHSLDNFPAPATRTLNTPGVYSPVMKMNSNASEPASSPSRSNAFTASNRFRSNSSPQTCTITQ